MLACVLACLRARAFFLRGGAVAGELVRRPRPLAGSECGRGRTAGRPEAAVCGSGESTGAGAGGAAARRTTDGERSLADGGGRAKGRRERADEMTEQGGREGD